ncbi:hypothetical protein [Nodosilinea nodulosa]|uniref:hypothetical protein n=1 Tax=Nodosilinea nodulosa TaxID=416001 RepID=UPI0012D8326A|nr:hypothetical protein [Nodosilinea nodulosa]
MATTLASDVVKHKERETVGNRKVMETSATLYRNGFMVIETLTDCNNWTEGLKGRVFVVCIDSLGRAIWVTKEYKCTTRGSKFDVTCPRKGKDNFQETVPEVVAQMTSSLDIVQDDGPINNWREQLRRQMNDLVDVEQGLKQAYNSLQ